MLAFAFLLLVLGALGFRLFMLGTDLRTRLGNRPAVATVLRWLSLALSLVALAMVINQIDLIGGPILYATLGLVCLCRIIGVKPE